MDDAGEVHDLNREPSLAITEGQYCEHRLDLPPYRPPSEAQSVLVRITRGCTWNRCAFCGMYKDLRFELRSALSARSLAPIHPALKAWMAANPQAANPQN